MINIRQNSRIIHSQLTTTIEHVDLQESKDNPHESAYKPYNKDNNNNNNNTDI
eukprot:CAMPEP_0116947996 /NCGR_PEP_ID=MMETSP0467-20121206/38031_1 /TAXON_ID=283647 /ORGANISM="Mesodinium pulex, Strain SPMC105" /LENGTH=52 /DNA_ID=CAMNT_0004632307 /DNA_START=1838 /DNA_END=1993 /DNA_ORIENTATION=+